MRALRLCSLFAIAAAAPSAAQDPLPPDDPWRAIAGPARGDVPQPMSGVEWRTDLAAAQALAVRDNRPLFVTFRCPPCKQCAAFDRDVLEGGPALDPLLRQFVTVRLTDARAIDLDRFPVEGFQDTDLSWWGWFLSPQGRVYGIFGGRDDAGDATRISVPALANTLRRVLAHHYDPRRADWNVDGPAPSGKPRPPVEHPGFASWNEKFGPIDDCACTVISSATSCGNQRSTPARSPNPTISRSGRCPRTSACTSTATTASR